MPLLPALTTPDLLILGDNNPAAGQATDGAGPRGWGLGLGGGDVSSHDLRVEGVLLRCNVEGEESVFVGTLSAQLCNPLCNCSRRHKVFSQLMSQPKQNHRGRVPFCVLQEGPGHKGQVFRTSCSPSGPENTAQLWERPDLGAVDPAGCHR